MSLVLINDWKLQANPFPHAGRSLAPQADPTQLGYYLDFYDWQTTDLLNGLAPNGSIDVSGLKSSDTVTILISGATGSGRSSVKNLLLYELEQASLAAAGGAADHKPIVLDVRVPLSTDQKQVALALSMLLISEAKRRSPAAAAQIQDTLRTWQDITGAGPPDVATLFATLQADVTTEFPGIDIIVVLDASSHSLTRDTARATNGMLKGFATYVIMSLTKPDDARFMRDELTGKRPAAWVNAPKVVPAVVKDYVAKRNAAHRAPGYAGPDQIFPFTDAAIDYLFKATSGAGHEGLSIGIVLEKLTWVMAQKAKTPGAPPSTITEADMQGLLG
jgi:hypothetical protein